MPSAKSPCACCMQGQTTRLHGHGDYTVSDWHYAKLDFPYVLSKSCRSYHLAIVARAPSASRASSSPPAVSPGLSPSCTQLTFKLDLVSP